MQVGNGNEASTFIGISPIPGKLGEKPSECKEWGESRRKSTLILTIPAPGLRGRALNTT